MKSILLSLKVILLATVLSFGLSYVYAWTAPTATPPGGNVSAPLNTSATAQIKSGGLTVGSLDAGGGSYFHNRISVRRQFQFHRCFKRRKFN
ncbi:MAG: hypothetical protein Q7K40_03795 [bacterium]|nr:hypothetical protein [bacterium]